jgi:tetratricopeptide (TPR) repeat protein
VAVNDRRRGPGWISALVCAAALLAHACGGSSVVVEDPTHLPPVDPAALAEYDAALQALEVGDERARARAAGHLEAAVAIDRTLWEGWYNLGVLRLSDGDTRGAERAFSAALELNRGHDASLMGRAEARRRAGRVQQAQGDYQALLARRPDDLAAATRLASLSREAGRYEDAIATIRAYLRAAGAEARIYVQLGLVYHAQGRADLAELVLRKAVELDDEEPAAYNALALVALGSGDDQRAFELFDRASALDPSYLDARFNKAAVLMDAGDYARGTAELRGVVEANPGDYDARVALGVGLRGSQDFDAARTMWEDVVSEARRSHPARGDALYNLAILELDFIMDLDAARAALDRYLQEAPDDHAKRGEATQRKEELGF